MNCLDSVDEDLAVQRPFRELPAIDISNIFAATAEPDSLVMEVVFLLWGEMASVQIVLQPNLVVLLEVHVEVS